MNRVRLINFVKVLALFVCVNIAVFEWFGDTSVIVQKEIQYLNFLRETNFQIFHSVANYIHSRAPLLEQTPYAYAAMDTRLSTWFLPPHQVVAEWTFFVTVFISTIVQGVPRCTVGKPTGSKRRYVDRLVTIVIFFSCVSTFIAVLCYKCRAWYQLGEWFALVYMFQPCHVLILTYSALSYLLLRSRAPTPSIRACAIFHVLFDLQWFTWVAIAMPDMDALISRNFFGEYFLFYYEHLLLIALPLVLKVTVFRDVRHPTRSDRLYRAWYSLAWFGIHHIQVMTPVSLVSGVQVNYQTHLPHYAHHWFGRAYKPIITSLSFLMMLMCAFVLEPAMTYVLSFRRVISTKNKPA